ncbi:sensor histidine kinase [Lewinella sp. W8]|uniref:sensor histidine kinase n=1 Tax=Lewinella sp. W8 TaxID=2528208 RepID=UPI00106826D2|nr:histidine kinase [Lewinella sp. W8]MTB50434.1 sensor histidine kinase [Lewinella sp. W8]
MSSFFTRNRKPLLHVAFWLVYASFFFYQISFGRRDEPDWSRIVPDVSFHIVSLLALSYLNYFFFLPQLLRDQALGRYLLRFLPVFSVLSYLILLGKRWLLSPYAETNSRLSSWLYSPRFAVSVILTSLFIVIFVGLLRFVEDYFRHEAERKENENQQLTSELRFLRAQVNPHFLFNTLNNLYYLAVKQSQKTPEVIAKLSGMMRYMLHDSNHPTVSLSREIEYMESYIELERMRLEDEVPIAFEVDMQSAKVSEGGASAGAVNPGGARNSNVRIVPLILITFLENAFKHGIGNGKGWITVALRLSGSQLSYTVKNSRVGESEKTVTEKSGIGLVNVRRRLELSYPDRHQLTVRETDDEYAVHLQLELT